MKYYTILVCVIYCGCCRNYDGNIQIKPSDLVGNWALSSAPQIVTNISSTNGFVDNSRFALMTDRSASFSVIPIEKSSIRDNPLTTGPQWSFVSGTAQWDLYDWGDEKYHIWKIGFCTSVKGIQFTVGKTTSKQLILIYTPDPDKPLECVVFTKQQR